jgi:hypothetical protein
MEAAAAINRASKSRCNSSDDAPSDH